MTDTTDDVATEVTTDETAAKPAPPAGALNPAEDTPEPAVTPSAPDLASLRQALAGDDEKFGKVLGRYTTAEAMREGWKNAIAAAQEKSKPLSLADDATEEQVAEYRKAIGLPEKADEYPIAFRDGFETTDADSEVLGSLKEALHAKGGDPRTAAIAMEWYQDTLLQQVQDANAYAATKAEETQELLRGEYGSEYKGNIEAAKTFLQQHLGDQGVSDFLTAKLEDGSRVQDSPEVVKMMVNLSRDYYGGTGIVNGDVETTAKTLDEKLSAFMTMKTESPSEYYSDKVQQEVAALYEQKKRLDARKR